MILQPEQALSSRQVHGTQSFVATLGECWRQPSLLGLELLWRWLFGIPALWLIYHETWPVLSQVSLAGTGMDSFGLQYPMQSAQALAAVAAIVLRPLLHIAKWLVPVLAIGWALASGFGRTMVLRRYDPELHLRTLTLVVLQLLRALSMTFAVWLWWNGLQAIAQRTLAGTPDPNFIAYFAEAIFFSLFMFTAWAVSSSALASAVLVSVVRGTGVLQSVRGAVSIGKLRGKLVEINLVLGIIKLMLIVLAIVFSATPLPFESIVTGAALHYWWVFVTVLYLAASDFFQVARLVAYIKLWRAQVTLHVGESA